jgi:hypothetical protein
MGHVTPIKTLFFLSKSLVIDGSALQRNGFYEFSFDNYSHTKTAISVLV